MLAAIALTVVLVIATIDFATNPASRRTLTSSTVASGLVLLALCGICWQAGFRLARGRDERYPTLFSRPAWFAIGAALLAIATLMAVLICAARRPTILDYQVFLSLGAFGAWCLVLACRPSGERPIDPANRNPRPRQRS